MEPESKAATNFVSVSVPSVSKATDMTRCDFEPSLLRKSKRMSEDVHPLKEALASGDKY